MGCVISFRYNADICPVYGNVDILHAIFEKNIECFCVAGNVGRAT